jgi:hypothetical protein
VHSQRIYTKQHQTLMSTPSTHPKIIFHTNCNDRLLKVFPRSAHPTFPIKITAIERLSERRLSILEQHLKVGLVPLASLWRGAERSRLSAKGVVTVRSAVAGTIGLSTGFDPNESICEWVASGGSRADTETGSVDAALVSLDLAEALHGVAACVDDGVGGHAVLLDERQDGVDVALLVLALVVLGIGGEGEFTGAGGPGVPAGDVGRNIEDLLGEPAVLYTLVSISVPGSVGNVSVLVLDGRMLGTNASWHPTRAILRDQHRCTWQHWEG